MNGKRLPQELIEADIQKATSSRDCPATGRECRIPDKKAAESDRLWAEYIQRCAKTHSTEIFSTADRQGFVECCKGCDIYTYHKYLQNLRKPIKQKINSEDRCPYIVPETECISETGYCKNCPNYKGSQTTIKSNQPAPLMHTSLIQKLQMAWDIIKSRTRG